MPQVNGNKGYSGNRGNRSSLSQYEKDKYREAKEDGFDDRQASEIALTETGFERSRRG